MTYEDSRPYSITPKQDSCATDLAGIEMCKESGMVDAAGTIRFDIFCYRLFTFDCVHVWLCGNGLD